VAMRRLPPAVKTPAEGVRFGVGRLPARVGGSASGLILGDMVDVLRAEVQVSARRGRGSRNGDAPQTGCRADTV
jgi:hypothetical protein